MQNKDYTARSFQQSSPRGFLAESGGSKKAGCLVKTHRATQSPRQAQTEVRSLRLESALDQVRSETSQKVPHGADDGQRNTWMKHKRELEGEADVLRSGRKQAEDEAEQLMAENERLQKSGREKDERLKSYEKEVAKMKSELAMANGRYAEWQDYHSQYERNVSKLREDFATIQTERDKLISLKEALTKESEAATAEAKEKEQAVEELTGKLEEAKACVKSAGDEIDVLKATQEKLLEEKAEMADQLSKATDASQNAENELQECRAVLSTTKEQKDKTELENTKFGRELRSLQSALQQAKAESERKAKIIDEMKAEREDSGKTIQLLTSRAEILESQNKNVKSLRVNAR